jgi:hypothetical protein
MGLFSEVLDEISIDRIRDHIKSLAVVRHPVVAPAALDQAAGYIADTLSSLGYSMSEHCFEDGGRRFSNVIATRSGTRYPEKRVIVLAHYDTVSISPGADDNASGVAVLLELAAALSSLSFEKSIQFIGVNLEENARDCDAGTGTRGSGALASFAREQGWDIEGVVVLESVAYAGDDVVQKAPAGIPLQVPEVGDFIAVIGNEESKGLVSAFGRAIERHRLPLPFLSLVVPGNGEMLPDTRRSDHAPFWDNGYRAIMVTDTTNFRNPHYHQASDTLETLNLPFALQVCRAAGSVLMELAGACSPVSRA